MVVRIVTTHGRVRWGGAALIGTAALAAAMLWVETRQAETAPRDAVTVVDAADGQPVSPPVQIVAAPAPAPPSTRPARREHSPAAATALTHAKQDGRMMGGLAVEQPQDARGNAIEQTVLSTFRAKLPISDTADVAVSCTITLCEVSGVSAGHDLAATRTALRNDGLLKAMAGLGYSTGPDEESPTPSGGTAFVFYFNRVM